MKNPLIVKSFLCGPLSVQAGSKAIAVLGMVFGVTASFVSVFVLPPPIDGDSNLTLSRLYGPFRWASAVGNLATALTSAVMYYGADTGRRRYLLPWLIMQGGSIVLGTI